MSVITVISQRTTQRLVKRWIHSFSAPITNIVRAILYKYSSEKGFEFDHSLKAELRLVIPMNVSCHSPIGNVVTQAGVRCQRL